MARRVFDWASPDAGEGGFLVLAEPGDAGGGGGALVTISDPTERLLPRLTEISDPIPLPTDGTFADYLPLGPISVAALTPWRIVYSLEAISGAGGGVDALQVVLTAYGGGGRSGGGGSGFNLMGAYPAAIGDQGSDLFVTDGVFPAAVDLYMLQYGSNVVDSTAAAAGPIHVRNRVLKRIY